MPPIWELSKIIFKKKKRKKGKREREQEEFGHIMLSLPDFAGHLEITTKEKHGHQYHCICIIQKHNRTVHVSSEDDQFQMNPCMLSCIHTGFRVRDAI